MNIMWFHAKMTNIINVLVTTIVFIFYISNMAFAITIQPLNGQYIIQTSVTKTSANSANFNYDITNVNQTNNQDCQGLTQFAVMVPTTATISNVSTPPTYIPNDRGSYWVNGFGSAADPGYKWLYWSAANCGAVYPSGTTVNFSFQAANVNIGLKTSQIVTFWHRDSTQGEPAPNGGYYSAYVSQPIQGPVENVCSLSITSLTGTSKIIVSDHGV